MDNIYCTPEEQQARVAICKDCPRFLVSNDRTYCLEASKSISLMISETNIKCPLEKW
jgi:hypothetical protein